MSEASVSVCITTHNDAHVLQRAFLSALQQTVPPLEVIIVDDGSDAEVIIPDTPDDYPHIACRVVRVTNRGLPAARNTGLMLAKGVGFLPLDADDWLEPTYVEKTLPLLLEGADVVLTGLQEHGPTRKGTYKPGYDTPWHLVSLDMMWKDNRAFYCSLHRTQLLREVGGYNPLMAGPYNRGGGLEDWDLTLDLMRRGAKYAYTDEILFNYSTANPASMIHRSMLSREALIGEMKRHHRRP